MNETKQLLLRLKKSADGQEFIDYLLELSNDNYEAFKKDGAAMNDIHKGYAIAIDNLLKAFAECDKEPMKLPEGNAWA